MPLITTDENQAKMQQKGAEEFQQEEFEAHLSDKNNRKK